MGWAKQFYELAFFYSLIAFRQLANPLPELASSGYSSHIRYTFIFSQPD